MAPIQPSTVVVCGAQEIPAVRTIRLLIGAGYWGLLDYTENILGVAAGAGICWLALRRKGRSCPPVTALHRTHVRG